jgi:hypothetical protein
MSRGSTDPAFGTTAGLVARGGVAHGAFGGMRPVSQRVIIAADGRAPRYCVEHTRPDGVTELIVRCGSETVWWPCEPGTIWQLTAAELSARMDAVAATNA